MSIDDALSMVIKDDNDYAYSWHKDVAGCAIDLGVDWNKSQKIAAYFMKNKFNADFETYAPENIKERVSVYDARD